MKTPTIDPSVFVADGAKIIGNVIIEKDCGIWYNAVVRAEHNSIVIGAGSNVQDNAVLHLDPWNNLTIGCGVTIGHGAIVHGCTIEDNCIIGMGSIVMNNAVIGAGSIVGAGAVVTENTIIPPRSIVVGSPAKVLKPCSDEAYEKILANAAHYVEAAREFKEMYG